MAMAMAPVAHTDRTLSRLMSYQIKELLAFVARPTINA
jgi:hypothetical protein